MKNSIKANKSEKSAKNIGIPHMNFPNLQGSMLNFQICKCLKLSWSKVPIR